MAAVVTVGLDIGSESIRAVETSRGKDGPVITNAGHALLPHGTVQGGAIQNDTVVTAALRQLWATTRFRTRRVTLGVSNPQVMVRAMSVTNLPRRELHKALPFQVRDLIPLPVERTLLDFQPLEVAKGIPTVRGLLIAAPKDAVLAAVQAVQRAGLFVERVDLASFALLRAGSRLDGQVEAIVDIGAHTTSVVVHIDGEPLIVRTIPRGGDEITETIATRLEASVREAETLKRRIGLRAEEESETAQAIQDAVRPLINEIRNSFAYLTSGDRPNQVARMILTGGGSLLPGLADTLQGELGVEVTYADALVRIRRLRRGANEGLDGFRSSAAVSVGLTLRAAA
jgi:type IV pilus assembly protein PilM